MRNFYIILLCIFLSSCKSDKREIIAYFNDEPIFFNEVDNLARQEMHDILYKVYAIRKVYLKEIIINKVIEKYKKDNNISETEFLNKLFTDLSDSTVYSFAAKFGITGLPKPGRQIVFTSIYHPDGRVLLIEKYKRYLLDQFADSLSKLYNVKTFLEPPKSPFVQLDKAIIHFRGNLNSKVTLIEVSDFECQKCLENHQLLNDIYLQYKDKVKFGFTHYSSVPTLSAICSEAAANQNKFWIFYDSIFNSKRYLDTLDFFRIGQSTKISLSKFKTDIISKNLKDSLKSNFEILRNEGLYATPSIIVNGNLVFDPSSKEEIERLIDSEIKKFY